MKLPLIGSFVCWLIGTAGVAYNILDIESLTANHTLSRIESNSLCTSTALTEQSIFIVITVTDAYEGHIIMTPKTQAVAFHVNNKIKKIKLTLEQSDTEQAPDICYSRDSNFNLIAFIGPHKSNLLYHWNAAE